MVHRYVTPRCEVWAKVEMPSTPRQTFSWRCELPATESVTVPTTEGPVTAQVCATHRAELLTEVAAGRNDRSEAPE